MAQPNFLTVFGIGIDGAIYRKFFVPDGGGWFPKVSSGTAKSTWASEFGQLLYAPAAVASARDRIDIFGIGMNGAMYHKWLESKSDWESLGGRFVSAPAAVASGPNRLDIFGLGGDDAMYHKAWEGSGWSGRESLGGKFL